MNGIEKAISTLNSCSRAVRRPLVDARVQLIVSIVYIVAVISVPLTDPGRLIWLFCYPIIMAEALSIGYGRLFVSSLWVLPLLAVIGIFNPLLDRAPMFVAWGFSVSKGWVTFAGVIVRGLLTAQALVMLIKSCGFNDLCHAMARLHVPKVLVTQLQMLYRFLTVVLEEALTMHRARQSRGFGRKSYPLRLWGTFIGQLLIRSMDRARRVNQAMLARGFSGLLPYSGPAQALRAKDWAYLVVWCAVIVAIRYTDLTALTAKLLSRF